MIYKRLFLVAALLWLSAAAQAQEKWTLDRCIKYALDNNLQLRIAKLDIETREANLYESKMARLPNLNGNASQNWNIGRSIDPFTNQFTNDPVRNNNFSMSSNTVLFNGFQQVNTIKQNNYLLQASQQDAEKAKNDMVLSITNAYLQIMLNRELINVARIQLQSTGEQLERTKKLIEAGRLPEANLYDVISQKANDELRIAQAENDLALAELRLKQLLQLPAGEKLDIKIPDMPEPGQVALSSSAEDIFKLAETTQPEVKSADLSIKSAAMGVEIARGNSLPTLSFTGTVFSFYSSQGSKQGATTLKTFPVGFFNDPVSGQRIPVFTEREIAAVEKNPFFSQLDLNLRQQLSFNLQIPIFNRFQIKTAVARATIQQRRAELQAQNTRNQLRQTIEQAYVDARAAAKSFESNKSRVKALEESARVTEQRFNLGAANSIDYALAKNNLAIAQSDLVRTKYTYILRLKILDFYEGKELKL